ncbi:Uncharacterized protein TCM_000727 isoform 2, partial [Theobroma cacao]
MSISKLVDQQSILDPHFHKVLCRQLIHFNQMVDP